MKKPLILLCVLTLVVGMTMSASAELVTITFDEDGISANCPPQGSGGLITDQYLDFGVEWIVDPGTEEPHNEVTRGECFNNAFDIGSDNQVLWYNGSTVEGNIQLEFLADSLAFDYRKPASDDQVQVKLYHGDDVVYDSGVFYAHGYWQTFEYDAVDPSGYFDRIQMYGPENKKFVIDNLEVNALVTITFDEAWVTSGPTTNRYDGTQVDTQYSFMGVTWVDTVDDDPNILTGQGVTDPDEFSGSWDNDKMLWNYGQGGGGTTPVNAPILLSVPADSFSFEFRRPQAPGTIDVRLYMGDELVHETIGFSWDPIVDGDWKTFSYSGDPFDKVVLSSGDKFNTDNYSFNLVGPLANQPPVLDLIGNQSVDEGEVLEFTISASDPDSGDTLTFSATHLPTGASFDAGTQTFSWTPDYTQSGSYDDVTFTVTDDGTPNLSDSETITISVGDVPHPPTANAGDDQTVDEGETVFLDGSGSDDPDPGDSITYEWVQIGDPTVTLSNPTAYNPSFTAPNVRSAGLELTFQLTVTDTGSLSDADTCSVYVNGVDEPPVADAGGPYDPVEEGHTVTLNGSAEDPDYGDSIVSYHWEQVFMQDPPEPTVVLSDETAQHPTFVTPAVEPGGTSVWFKVKAADKDGLESDWTDPVEILVNDNGIEGFPADVITTMSSTGEPIGLRCGPGGDLIGLDIIDPDTLPDEGKPDDLIYGLLGTQIKCDNPGASVDLTLIFLDPVPDDYTVFKYGFRFDDTAVPPACEAIQSWYDFEDYVSFNTNRTEVTLSLTDGGAGDHNCAKDGIIVDPFAIGTAPVAEPLAEGPELELPSLKLFDGGGNCFINTAGSGGLW